MDRIVYAAFDRFPAPKGAAVHIEAFARALGAAFGGVNLITVADEQVGEPVPIPGVNHFPLSAVGADLIERVANFRAHLLAWWNGRCFEVVHVRSIFEGYPIARHKEAWCDQFVFEVNGLPSIELKYNYPAVADDRELLRKLTAMEDRCLSAADLVVTISHVTAGYLVGRGVSPDRIRVISNGVDVDVFRERIPLPVDGRIRLLYAGTMSSWQGVRLTIEALALLNRDVPATLALAGPARARQERELRELCWELGVADAVRFIGPVDQAALAKLHHESDVVLAPLTANDRNLVQGCCPLKILEAMASGTPLIASDLPVVRELARPEVDALLVRPGSAKAIKDAVLRLVNDPALARRLAKSAREVVVRERTWGDAQASLLAAYKEVVGIASCPN
jgi:glycosyltransferase involved in cell wall biosynthesis